MPEPSPRLKINFVIPNLSGLSGGLKVVAQYACYLQAAGHEVALLVPTSRRRGGLRSRIRALMGRKVRVRYSDDDSRGHFEDADLATIDIPLIEGTLAVDAVPDADLMVATWWETLEWIADLPAEKGTKVHFIQDHEIFPYLPRHRTEAVHRLPFAKVAVSRWLVDAMRSDYGAESLLAANGVDLARFAAPPRGRNPNFTVGFLYGHSPRKNTALAVEAVKAAREILPDLRVMSFGAHPRDEDLPEWIHYEQRPAQDRIPQIYADCDAWLFPTESEGFGLPLLEAMASRTPLISTSAGAAPDLIDERNGWIVRRNVDSFSNAIVRMAALTDDEWRAMSDAAWATAQSHGLDDAARGFETALDQILRAAQTSLVPDRLLG